LLFSATNHIKTGYPTHFGQLECMKLTASPHFPEKRIGYLGMMLLLSEEADVLMLATNALKNDLTSENRFVAGLALCCIGNLATADMSRDLAPEVDKHLKSPLSYLRKKACLAMARCLSKCPDMVEDFAERVASLLKDKSHGVLITVVQLMTQVLMIDYRNAEQEGDDPFSTECRTTFLELVPTLVKMLRNLLGSGYAPEHDVSGIADPFLQVQLLTLLRLLGCKNVKASEEMNDVLAQVATNTESAKNAGNAILYECVLTIMGIESEDGLRVLAVNILGRFLLNRDNNIRYVALNTLAKCLVEQKQGGHGSSNLMLDDIDDGEASNTTANSAMSALQRHRTTVVECLKDPDVSIRQRALELIYHLVNASNVESLTSELLNYLVLCPREHRGDICTRILKVVDHYSPDDRWRIDTLITTLTIAGREANRSVQNATVIYVSRTSADLQAFAVHKLLKAIRDDDGTQYGLLAVGVWCIGEYGDLLLQPYVSTPAASFQSMEPNAIVEEIERVTNRHGCPEWVRQRTLTAYVKLYNRFANTNDTVAINRLQQLLQKHQGSRSLELQVRSCEFNALVNATKGLKLVATKPPTINNDDLFSMENGSTDASSGTVSAGVISAAKEALSRMPVVDIKVLQQRLNRDAFSGDGTADMISGPSKATIPTKSSQNGGASGDLLDIFGGDGLVPTALSTQNGSSGVAKTDPNAGKSDLDLLSDIFSAQPSTSTIAPAAPTGSYDPFSASTPHVAAAPATTINPLDLFGAPPTSTVPSTSSAMPHDIFGASPLMQQQNVSQPPPTATMDLFGGTPSFAPAVSAGGLRVPALSHAGLTVEFECTKPESFDQQKSILLAHFTNTTNTPIHGMNLQVAVPKFVKMELEPPTSTTIPPSNNMNANAVTQKVTVTNSMLGTKNLVLKLKIGFTSNGQKIEQMATCSGFPPGQY
jgi:AP-1 complex subunit gamma-1